MVIAGGDDTLALIIAPLHAVVLAFSEIFFFWVISTSKTYSELHAS